MKILVLVSVFHLKSNVVRRFESAILILSSFSSESSLLKLDYSSSNGKIVPRGEMLFTFSSSVIIIHKTTPNASWRYL